MALKAKIPNYLKKIDGSMANHSHAYALIPPIGIYTKSWKKIMVTYMAGIVGIAGLLLPDWDFFDRDFSRWTCPVTFEERASIQSQRQTSLCRRYRIYPLRLAAYTTVYGFALYKWWKFISK